MLRGMSSKCLKPSLQVCMESWVKKQDRPRCSNLSLSNLLNNSIHSRLLRTNILTLSAIPKLLEQMDSLRLLHLHMLRPRMIKLVEALDPILTTPRLNSPQRPSRAHKNYQCLQPKEAFVENWTVFAKRDPT